MQLILNTTRSKLTLTLVITTVHHNDTGNNTASDLLKAFEFEWGPLLGVGLIAIRHEYRNTQSYNAASIHRSQAKVFTQYSLSRFKGSVQVNV